MQNNNALIAIAAAATALAAAATALVSGAEVTTCATLPPAASTDDAPPQQEEAPAPTKKRGRPPGTAAPTPEAPAPTDAVKPESEPEAKKPEVTGMSLEELQALIKPLIEDGQGADVKKVITKYATKLAEIDAKDHAAFAKDIQALSM